MRLAKLGADYARAGNVLMALDYTATLRGWFECATYAQDMETAQAANRASEWVACASDYHAGYAHPITEAASRLMWGEAA
ncbi:MAG: hypothetical protein Q7Q73_09240 [Verrucomicrobiota bacterium JB024]|nr:hypothetical protein [Verrucomicrobiota bacterium JB024]